MFYQRLIRLRRNSVILQRGGLQMLVIEADTLVYQREAFARRILTTAHRGVDPRPAGRLPLRMEASLTGHASKISLPVKISG